MSQYRDPKTKDNNAKMTKVENTMETKTCLYCKNEYPKTRKWFYGNVSNSDGLSDYCQTCYLFLQQKGAFKQTPPTTKTCAKCGQSFPCSTDYFYHRAGNADRLDQNCIKCARDVAIQISKRPSVKQAATVAKRIYRAKHPHKARVLTERRRAWKLSAEGTHTEQDIVDLYDLQDGRCVYCAMPVGDNYHVDHMTPLSRGGSNWPDNLAITCPPCNLSKNDKTADEFIAWLKVNG